MRHLLVLFLFCLSFLASYTLFAADPPKKPLPIVIVFKADNSTVRGKLIAADPDSLTVQPTTIPAQPDPIQIPWSDISKVSNGLTQQKALAQWKIDNKDRLCPICHGDRYVTCPTCKGTGKDLRVRVDCPACHGAGTIKCTNPKCTDGKIPCPGPCLKLAVGPWTKHPDGLHWRRFATPDGGYFEFSEHHLGQVVEMKNGQPTGNLVDCPICHGAGNITCPTCNGTALLPCPDCKKSDAPQCPDLCDNGKIKCKDCNGAGLRPN